MATQQRARKQPQDHKPPEEKKQEKPTIVIVNGVRIPVDGSMLDDLEFVEAVYDLSEDPESNSLEIVQFLRKLFGDQYRTFKDAIRDEATGRVPISDVGDALADVLNQMNPNS